MSNVREQCYPRPDFERPDLTWTSLNGLWDFLFDDEDVGLARHWQRSGLRAHSKRDASSSLTNKNIKPETLTVEKGSNHQLAAHEIEVPYVFQTPASNINDQSAHQVLWYERNIFDIRTQIEVEKGYRLLLRFGAVDYEATLWVNGCFVGDHQGGHVPFDIDVTDAVEPATQHNRLSVRVRDSPYDLTQPRGKQYWKPQPESIFYTPSSGIWQTVWLESVPRTRIADSSHGMIIRSDNLDSGVLQAEIPILGRRAQEPLAIEISASIGSVSVCTVRQDLPTETDSVGVDLSTALNQNLLESSPAFLPPVSNTSAWRSIDEKYIALWSPEYPLLYSITVKLLQPSGEVLDEVHTTTGMRSISWSHPDRTFRLNGKPYFQALVLDQGYWPRTNMTPPSPDALKLDIELSKAMGFNGCRKHQKVEDPLFLYWADCLGYLVWGEMANAYQFSSTYVDRFDAEWRAAMRRDINHPCIVTWTPINESWGYDDLKGNKRQRDHLRSLYHATKTLDPTRPVNDNCGWEHVATDLTTFHEYADAPMLKDICTTMDGILNDKGGRNTFVPPMSNDPGSKAAPTGPVLCTEFGGVNIAPAEGAETGDRDWGYTTATDPEDLLKRVEALVMAVVDGGHCCGFVYTQLTDIEQEVNGLYSFDRKPKLDVERLKVIMDKARTRYFELLEQRQ